MTSASIADCKESLGVAAGQVGCPRPGDHDGVGVGVADHDGGDHGVTVYLVECHPPV